MVVGMYFFFKIEEVEEEGISLALVGMWIIIDPASHNQPITSIQLELDLTFS